jgi:EAL domain-containing protein (putative c-di-GMP-specific phosphodiesterase class I)
VEIDRWVMKTAMRQVKKWNRKGFIPGKLSLNLTLTNLRRDDYLTTLQSCLDKHNFDPANLELEITESEVMKEFEEVIIKLRSISSMNIDIAIDDFGTGHSSLSYLKKLPVRKLKIDKSFVDDIPENEEDVAIVKTIISLANNLNLTIVAEGVEREIQKDFLFQNGCRYIQGHYFSVPLSALEFEKKYFTEKLNKL